MSGANIVRFLLSGDVNVFAFDKFQFNYKSHVDVNFSFPQFSSTEKEKFTRVNFQVEQLISTHVEGVNSATEFRLQFFSIDSCYSVV